MGEAPTVVDFDHHSRKHATGWVEQHAELHDKVRLTSQCCPEKAIIITE